MEYALLLVFLLPALGVPFVYLAGKKSHKAAAMLVALFARRRNIFSGSCSRSLGKRSSFEHSFMIFASIC